MIENSNKEETASLHQNLGLPTAISTVVGCVIGSGIFFKPQAIYTVTGGAPGLGMLAWVITGLVSIAAALTFAEIAVLFPETGGIPTYLSRVYGPKAGFLAGWVQVVLFYPAMVSALAVALRSAGGAVYRGGFCGSLRGRRNSFDCLFEYVRIQGGRRRSGGIYYL